MPGAVAREAHVGNLRPAGNDGRDRPGPVGKGIAGGAAGEVDEEVLVQERSVAHVRLQRDQAEEANGARVRLPVEDEEPAVRLREDTAVLPLILGIVARANDD